MATWITHLMVVDELYQLGLKLDEVGYCVGNIGPDCNVENDSWTEYNPPKEVTHWMNGKSKLTADFEGFFENYVLGKVFDSLEEFAFLMGYYSHLVVDVEFQRFVRDERRVKDIFIRIKEKENLRLKIAGMPEDFDTLKSVFGKWYIFDDIHIQEQRYLADHEESRYNTILKKINSFPDYLDYMPEGAISRKLKIITAQSNQFEEREEFLFFSEEEMIGFTKETAALIFRLMKEKGVQWI